MRSHRISAFRAAIICLVAGDCRCKPGWSADLEKRQMPCSHGFAGSAAVQMGLARAKI
jgi:hypothetical protein